jgi:muramoyltetrapeptide carboxypeptidase
MRIPQPPIERRSVIGVVYPSSRPPEEKLQRGLSILEEWGYQIRDFRPTSAADDYLAAPDAERATALMRALADEEVALLWAARGGYGVIRLLARMTIPGRLRRPPMVGFSDVSLLLAHLAQKSNWPAIHGPNVTTLATLDVASQAAVKRFLTKGTFGPLRGLRTLVPGEATGRLLPINLTLLLSVAGTPHLPDLSGAILVLEDTGEPAYRVDRLLQQLRLLPESHHMAGLVVGDMAGHQERPLIRNLLVELAKELNVPCCSGAPVGHGAANQPLPVGALAHLNGGLGVLEILNS